MRTLLLLSLLIVAQAPVVEVTLSEVLLYTYPGVEWTLEQPAPPEEPSITLWDSTDPQPTIAALEAIQDNPSTGLVVFVEAVAMFGTDPPSTEAEVRAYVTAQCTARVCDATVVTDRLFPTSPPTP